MLGGKREILTLEEGLALIKSAPSPFAYLPEISKVLTKKRQGLPGRIDIRTFLFVKLTVLKLKCC